MREQTISDEAQVKADKAIRLYAELAELITGIEVEYRGQNGGPEACLYFIAEPCCLPTEGETTEVATPKQVEEFVKNTEYITIEIEKLMKKAVIEETMDRRYYTPSDTLGLIEGCILDICR